MGIATTFGSSTLHSDAKEYEEGRQLGHFLTQRGYQVRCGGYGGLMEAVSLGVKEANGECLGICLHYFEHQRPENPYITNKIVSPDIYERLRNLIEESELFIIQKGSLGTLNELLMIWTLLYIGDKKDVRVCLIGSEWQELRQWSLIEEKLLDMLEFYDNMDDFIQRSQI